MFFEKRSIHTQLPHKPKVKPMSLRDKSAKRGALAERIAEITKALNEGLKAHLNKISKEDVMAEADEQSAVVEEGAANTESDAQEETAEEPKKKRKKTETEETATAE